MSDETIKRLPRNWRDYYEFVSVLPDFIVEAKKRFGSDIALVLHLIYTNISENVARRIYSKMIELGDTRRILFYIQRKVQLMDEDTQRTLNRIIERMLVSYELEKLHEELTRRRASEQEKQQAVELFMRILREERVVPSHRHILRLIYGKR